MKGKKNSSQFLENKRQLLEAIMHGHDQKETPATRETIIVIATRTMRIIERIWSTCGADEAWRCVRSYERREMPIIEQKRRRTDR